MFEPGPSDFLQIPLDRPPQLIVTIDTEAEFDWNGPYSRDNNRVESISELHHAQEIFDRHGIVPAYLIDYAIASDARAVRVLRDLMEAGKCEIGAHLNPWLTPPFEERVDSFHSYACNLPADLEYRKLENLTLKISQQFGSAPRIYRAGRYGIGSDTARILAALEYKVDMSVMPHTSYLDADGPDFRQFDERPFWFGFNKRLLEIPITCGYSGWFANYGQSVFPHISGRIGTRLHLPGIVARLQVLERMRLTPENVPLGEMRRLTASLYKRGRRIFCMAFHSPSLSPGKTPYVRNYKDLSELLERIESYIRFFKERNAGQFTTPSRFFDYCCTKDAH